jgi:light-regulated signal transduction histidine kinase (bacteriophytochrome)
LKRDCRIDNVCEDAQKMQVGRGGWVLLLLGVLLAGAASLSLATPATQLVIHPGLGIAFGAAIFTLGVLIGVRSSGARSLDERNRSMNRELTGARNELAVCREDTDALQRSVSHDLRSPIGAVLNFATVLELDHGDDLGPEGRSIVHRIRRSAESALVLLDALSRLSRVSRAPLRLAPLDVEAIVRQAFAELGQTGARVELAIGTLPPAVADADLLRTAFGELLANAAKFTGARNKPQVAVGGRREPNGSVTYWVADDGVGFDMRFTGKLFRAFERLHSRDEFPGAGAGLAIVRKIAERHGGRAWAEGSIGDGARFYLSLPESRTEVE